MPSSADQFFADLDRARADVRTMKAKVAEYVSKNEALSRQVKELQDSSEREAEALGLLASARQSIARLESELQASNAERDGLSKRLARAESQLADANADVAEHISEAELAEKLSELGFSFQGGRWPSVARSTEEIPGKLHAKHPVLGAISAGDPETLVRRAKSKVEAKSRLKAGGN